MKKGKAMPIDLAEKEVENWLSAIGVDETEKEEKEDFIKKIVGKVSSGNIHFNEKGLICYKLIFPLKAQDVEFNTSELVFNRINSGELVEKTQGAEGMEYILRGAAISTGKANGEIKTLDAKDFMIVVAITNFFL